MNKLDKSNVRPEITDDITPSIYFNKLVMDRINMCPIPKIPTINALVEFCINGKDEGKWGLVIEKGMVKDVICAKEEDIDPYSRKPNCTFTMNGETFLSIIRKEISPQKAFFDRKVNVQGNMLLALKANVLVNYL